MNNESFWTGAVFDFKFKCFFILKMQKLQAISQDRVLQPRRKGFVEVFVEPGYEELNILGPP